MTSTNDGKDVKSNQTSSQKGKSYFIDLYKTLDSQLKADSDVETRVGHLHSAWQRVHTLCVHSAPPTRVHLLGWIQQHTATTVLHAEWSKNKDAHKKLEAAIDGFLAECEQDGRSEQAAWERELVARARSLRAAIPDPWGHPVLRSLLDPKAQRPSTDELLTWLKEERGLVFAARLRQLAVKKCQDVALDLLTVVMDNVRLSRPPVCDESIDDASSQAQSEEPTTFESVLSREAGFAEVWDLLIDMELVLLHKTGRNARIIDLIKSTPLENGHQLVDRLISRLANHPKEKKIWKNAKDVAKLVSTVMITRCMVVPACTGIVLKILYWCSRALVKVLTVSQLGEATLMLAAPARTARHLHTLATAVHAQLSAESEEMKPFVVELYVRAITFGMNELEKLKLQPEYEEKEARSTERTLASWFMQLGELLSGSARVRGECALTAFSLHPSPQLYDKIRQSPALPPVALDTSPKKEETETTKNSWANDSHSLTNFVKTSETLNIKLSQNQANVLSTAIFNEGEALGLNPELCQDIIVLLSGPRVKTLSWDMDRELLLENCRTYMERTQYGTRALTTKLEYLNLDLSQYQHLPEEEDNDDDIYYGIEKGYEHLVEIEPADPTPEAVWDFDVERTDTEDEIQVPRRRKKKKSKAMDYSSESDMDPLSLVAENKRLEKKERPHSKERSKERKQKLEPKEHFDTDGNDLDVESHSQSQSKKKDKKEKKKEKKERKKREKKEQQPSKTHSNVIGMKVETVIPRLLTNAVTDSDYDSQGKSSLQSEGLEETVQYDGHFSMDELKSPDNNTKSQVFHKNLDKELDIASSQLSKVLNFPNLTASVTQAKIQSATSSTAALQATVNTSSSKNTAVASIQSCQSVREDVKKSISKLIQFRRLKADGIKIKPDPGRTVSNTTPNLSRLVGTKVEYQTAEFHSKPPDQLSTKKEKDSKIHSKTKVSSSTASKPAFCSRTMPYVAKPKKITPSGSTSPSSSTSTENLVTSNAMDLSLPTDSTPLTPQPHTSLSPGSSHLNSYQKFLQEWQKSVNLPNFTEDGKRENRPQSRVIPPSPKTEPIRDQITGQTVPMPTTVSPQCAKPIPQKKVESVPSQAPNTFARLSYMHKNKLIDKPKPDLGQSAYHQAVSAELDRRIADLKAAKSNIDKHSPKHQDKPKVEVQFIEPSVIPSNLDRDHPVLTNILNNRDGVTVKRASNLENNHLRTYGSNKNSSLTQKDQQDILKLLGQQTLMNAYKTALQIKSTSQETQIKNANVISQLTPPRQILTNDMKPLLNQVMSQYTVSDNIVNKTIPVSSNQVKYNEPKLTLTPVASLPHASNVEMPIISTSGSPTSLQKHDVKLKTITNISQEKGEITEIANILANMPGTSFQCPVISNKTILKTTAMVQNKAASPKPKAKGKATQRNKILTTSVPDIEVNKSVSKKYVPKPPVATPKQYAELEEQNWAKVLDELRAHKTPNRGPNALDLLSSKCSLENNDRGRSPLARKMEYYVSSVLKEQEMQNQPTTIIRQTSIKPASPVQVPPKKVDAPIKSQIKQTKTISTPKPVKISTDNTKTVSQTKIHSREDSSISGIKHSDYELLEELMDDDLRKEIGELSSDEDNFSATAAPMKNKIVGNNNPEVGFKSNVPTEVMPKMVEHYIIKNTTSQPNQPVGNKSSEGGFKSNILNDVTAKAVETLFISNNISQSNHPASTSPNISQNHKPRIISNEKVDIRNLSENIMHSVIGSGSIKTSNKLHEGTFKTAKDIPLTKSPSTQNKSEILRNLVPVSSQNSGPNMVIFDPFGVSAANQNFVPVDNTSKLIYQPINPKIDNQVIMTNVPAVNTQPTLVNITYATPVVVPVLVPTMLPNVVISDATSLVINPHIPTVKENFGFSSCVNKVINEQPKSPEAVKANLDIRSTSDFNITAKTKDHSNPTSVSHFIDNTCENSKRDYSSEAQEKLKSAELSALAQRVKSVDTSSSYETSENNQSSKKFEASTTSNQIHLNDHNEKPFEVKQTEIDNINTDNSTRLDCPIMHEQKSIEERFGSIEGKKEKELEALCRNEQFPLLNKAERQIRKAKVKLKNKASNELKRSVLVDENPILEMKSISQIAMDRAIGNVENNHTSVASHAVLSNELAETDNKKSLNNVSPAVNCKPAAVTKPNASQRRTSKRIQMGNTKKSKDKKTINVIPESKIYDQDNTTVAVKSSGVSEQNAKEQQKQEKVQNKGCNHNEKMLTQTKKSTTKSEKRACSKNNTPLPSLKIENDITQEPLKDDKESIASSDKVAANKENSHLQNFRLDAHEASSNPDSKNASENTVKNVPQSISDKEELKTIKKTLTDTEELESSDIKTSAYAETSVSKTSNKNQKASPQSEIFPNTGKNVHKEGSPINGNNDIKNQIPNMFSKEQKLFANKTLNKLVDDIESALSVITETTVISPIVEIPTEKNYELEQTVISPSLIDDTNTIILPDNPFNFITTNTIPPEFTKESDSQMAKDCVHNPLILHEDKTQQNNCDELLTKNGNTSDNETENKTLLDAYTIKQSNDDKLTLATNLPTNVVNKFIDTISVKSSDSDTELSKQSNVTTMIAQAIIKMPTEDINILQKPANQTFFLQHKESNKMISCEDKDTISISDDSDLETKKGNSNQFITGNKTSTLGKIDPKVTNLITEMNTVTDRNENDNIATQMKTKNTISISDDSDLETKKGNSNKLIARNKTSTHDKIEPKVNNLITEMNTLTDRNENDNNAAQMETKDTISISDDSDLETTKGHSDKFIMGNKTTTHDKIKVTNLVTEIHTALDSKSNAISTQMKINKNISEHHINAEQVPQEYKESIKIQEVPMHGNQDPLLKCVRIKLPNNKAFKAKIYGKLNIDFNTLFQQPSLKNILLSSLSGNKRYTLNLQNILTRDNKIIDTKISNLIEKDINPTQTDTVNLLSDEENLSSENETKYPTQQFKTECGSFKIKAIDGAIFAKHQEKLFKKCEIKLQRCDVEPKIPETDDLVEALLKDLIPAADATQVIEIDDSSSDEDSQSNKTNIEDLKVQLLKEFGALDLITNEPILIEDDNKLTNGSVVENKINRPSRTRKSKYHRDRNSSSNSVESAKRSTSNSKRSRNNKLSSGNSQRDIYSNIITRDCFVKLIKCDHMVKKNRKADDVIFCNDLEQNAGLFRSGSLSLLDEVALDDKLPVLGQVTYLSKNIIDRSSPVMEIYDIIVDTQNSSNQKGDEIICDVVCISDWYATKTVLHSECQIEKLATIDLEDLNKSDSTTNCETDCTDVETTMSDTESNFEAPSLQTIMASYFENNPLVTILKPQQMATTKYLCKSPIKRKLCGIDDKEIKISKMIEESIESEVIKNIATDFNIDRSETHTVLNTPRSLCDITIKYLLSKTAINIFLNTLDGAHYEETKENVCSKTKEFAEEQYIEPADKNIFLDTTNNEVSDEHPNSPSLVECLPEYVIDFELKISKSEDDVCLDEQKTLINVSIDKTNIAQTSTAVSLNKEEDKIEATACTTLNRQDELSVKITEDINDNESLKPTQVSNTVSLSHFVNKNNKIVFDNSDEVKNSPNKDEIPNNTQINKDLVADSAVKELKQSTYESTEDHYVVSDENVNKTTAGLNERNNSDEVKTPSDQFVKYQPLNKISDNQHESVMTNNINTETTITDSPKTVPNESIEDITEYENTQSLSDEEIKIITEEKTMNMLVEKTTNNKATERDNSILCEKNEIRNSQLDELNESHLLMTDNILPDKIIKYSTGTEMTSNTIPDIKQMNNVDLIVTQSNNSGISVFDKSGELPEIVNKHEIRLKSNTNLVMYRETESDTGAQIICEAEYKNTKLNLSKLAFQIEALQNTSQSVEKPAEKVVSKNIVNKTKDEEEGSYYDNNFIQGDVQQEKPCVNSCFSSEKSEEILSQKQPKEHTPEEAASDIINIFDTPKRVTTEQVKESSAHTYAQDETITTVKENSKLIQTDMQDNNNVSKPGESSTWSSIELTPQKIEQKYLCETEVVVEEEKPDVEQISEAHTVSCYENEIIVERSIGEIDYDDAFLGKNATLVYKDDSGVILKGIEYEDPEIGTCYVFPLAKSSDVSGASELLNESISSTIEVVKVVDTDADEIKNAFDFKPSIDLYGSEDLYVKKPKFTYFNPRHSSRLMTTERTKKRKSDIKDMSVSEKRPRRFFKPQEIPNEVSKYQNKFVEKKYRKGKNIDSPKLSATSMGMASYGKEFKRHMDYFDTVKFSYSITYSKEFIDVPELLNKWPIKGPCRSTCVDELDIRYALFTNSDDVETCVQEPFKLTLSEELATEYNDELYPNDIPLDETNYNMGFGEGSGRVIQNLDGGAISKFSAATLSDVKPSQPFLLSECDCSYQPPSPQEQIEIIKKYVNYVKLKEKVRSFFKNTTLELTRMPKKRKDSNDYEEASSFPFELYIPRTIEPRPVEAIVQVVQVGQLPVSAAAQNPVSCDPRVTQVSDASPSQCSVENSPHDSQQDIKTEYTELTTAELNIPLMEEYVHQNLPTERPDDMPIKTENVPVHTDSNEDKENNINKEKSDQGKPVENYEQRSDGNNFLYNSNTNNSMESQMQALFESEKQAQGETANEPKPQNGSMEKMDQIAHAMSAAGITTNESVTNARTQAFVNLISQKIRQSAAVVSSPNSPNTYPKTTSLNAVSLQQALAQILPPPLNQTNSSENNQQGQNIVAPQVLHIVQGKTPAGNQITLVDNSQQSVLNAPNATPVLHIVQNKPATPGSAANGSPVQQTNTFSGLSLVDAGLQQGGNQLLHIVNTGNQKNSNASQLLKRVNLLTNLANVQGSNEQKMVQFVCKSADGKSIQLNAPHQRGMVLRLQPIETTTVQQPPSTPKTAETPEPTQKQSTSNSVSTKDTPVPQEIKSRSIYEENYAKFIQSSSSKTTVLEKSQSLPKFNQAFGKPVFQDGSQKQNEINSNNLTPASTGNESNDCSQQENSVNLDHIGQLSSPPLLLRKPAATTQAPTNLVQQIKQTIAPMNIQTMHGGVIYTRQIPVNIGGGQTINLITVPSTELVDENGQKQQINQENIEPSIIKIVPQTTNTETNPDGVSINDENAQQTPPQPQPVLTQMRIKLPMLSKNPQMVSGARVVRPSFFQIQRNIVGGANQQVYQQLVLTAAPPLGQQTIRLPHAQSRTIKVPETQSQSSSESQMSSSTLEQLREFDMVLEQVKERSTVQPNSNSNHAFKVHTSSTDTTDSPANTTSAAETTQVLYSIGSNQPLNVTYVNRKTTVNTPTTSTFVKSPDSTGMADSPSSSTNVQMVHTVTTESSPNETALPKPAKSHSKSKSRPKSSSHTSSLKLNSSVPPKTSAQKPLEDEQTTQRILYILAEYKEQVENSPDKDKPAPRRRTNPPTNPPGSSKRKKSSSGSRRSGRGISPVHGEETCRTMGSEDSSCGTSQGDCTESCLESHSPQDSPRKVPRKLNFDQDPPTPQPVTPKPQTQRNVIVADGQTITVSRSSTGKPATAVLMPANYILPVSMVKGGQQIAIVTNRGPKLLTVGGGEGSATNALLLQRLIGPAGLKPVLARPGVRHVRLPTAALQNLQAFNLATSSSTQPPDSTASSVSETTPPDLVETSRNNSSPWTDRSDTKPDRASSPEESEPWNLASSADPHDYGYEETVRSENLDRTVLDQIQDRYSPDMEAQRIFDKMFDVDTKKSYIVDSVDSPRCAYDIDASDCDDKPYQVVHKKDTSRQGRFAHVSAAALRHRYAMFEHELRLQKSLSEECEDLGVDSPSASELFPEAELLFTSSPAQDHASHDTPHQSHTPQPTQANQSAIRPDIDDQIATDQLIQRENAPDAREDLVNLGLEDVGIVTVSEDGMQATIALDQEEFARSHPNTTFHSEPTDEGEVQPFTISGLKTRHITSTIFHSNRAPATVLMTAPQTTVISQAAADNSQHPVKYAEMIHPIPSTHTNNINLASVLVKDEGLTRYDNILTDSRELHLSNTASAIVHPAGHATQVIRRVCYEDSKRERESYLIDEPESVIAGDDAKMVAEDNSRDATLESIGGDVDDGNSSPERHTDLFWESNSASERSESRRPLDFSSDSEKCCKSPSYDETNSTDSSGVGAHMRLDSVIKDARGIDRSGSADGSSADDTHPPLRTYPPKRTFHPESDVGRSLSGKTRAGERSPDSLEVRRRASVRGVVKRGCHCCNGSPAPPRPKKPRQRKPTLDFTH